jgi:hypothetical protein
MVALPGTSGVVVVKSTRRGGGRLGLGAPEEAESDRSVSIGEEGLAGSGGSFSRLVVSIGGRNAVFLVSKRAGVLYSSIILTVSAEYRQRGEG